MELTMVMDTAIAITIAMLIIEAEETLIITVPETAQDLVTMHQMQEILVEADEAQLIDLTFLIQEETLLSIRDQHQDSDLV